MSAGAEAGALARALELAREGRLYPATILHGGDETARQEAAIDVARALLCERDPGERPCGACRHCRRIVWPPPRDKKREPEDPYHPDFDVLQRDLKTSTSVEATRNWLEFVGQSPFEARGQVYVIAEADSLSPGAGDALLKVIEEPGLATPRHFLLLAPSRLDLPATLRSRSMALFLGSGAAVEPERVREVAEAFGASVARWAAGGGAIFLLDAAARLGAAGDFTDARAVAPWLTASRAVRDAALGERLADQDALRPRLLALGEELLEISHLRLRGIPAERILEGLVSKHLAGAIPH